MIKYIFTKSELKTMFYLTGHGDFKCELFDVMTLEQDEFDDAEEGLIAKNVIFRVNNSDIKVDKMFTSLIDVIAGAEYITGKKPVIVFVGASKRGGIAIVMEEDPRNENIIKMIPYRNIEEVAEEYGMDILLPSGDLDKSKGDTNE